VTPSALKHLYHEDIYTIPATVLIVLDREWTSISEEEKSLLTKILGAVRLSPATVQIVTMPDLSLESIKQLGATKVIIFGSSVKELIKPYENTTLNGMTIVIADALGDLDDAKKKSLWLTLKQMFNL
jgi:hypothetical protein